MARQLDTIVEAVTLATDSLVTQPVRSTLAIVGIVIGIVTVVLVASVLANVRNQIALLFRELGTENVFAFHLSGDPYSGPSEDEVTREPLEVGFAPRIAELSDAISAVGVEVIVPNTVNGTPLVARSRFADSDSVLVEGASANFFEIVGAEFAEGRPFTELEERAAARTAIVGSRLARALFGSRSAVGRRLTLAGDSYVVVGELAERRGGFFGENRQDSVLTLPAATVQRRFGSPERVVLYARARPGQIERASIELEALLRRLRGLRPDEPNDFNLSTAEQIIGVFDQVGAGIAAVTIALAAVSLFIGGLGIANVMIISVTERTREIGLRLALGARRRNVLLQFVFEAAFLSGAGGLIGVATALAIGAVLSLFLAGYSAVPPAWSMIAGIGVAVAVGLAAGILPARRASRLDPSAALRHA